MLLKKTSGLIILSLLISLLVTAAPGAGAGEATLAAPEAAPAPEQPGCQPAVDLFAALEAEARICPAAPEAQTGAPELLAARGRTCRCSCGFPCRTDADCGPGGVCAAGITCC